MPNAADLFTPPPRRRLYLMRHGAVDYFLPDGTPLPPHEVPLNAAGRAQADAAGALFAAAGVVFGDTGTSKGKTIRTLMEKYNITSCAYIGDTQGDYEATVEAGVPFLWASYGFGTPAGYAGKIDSFTDLLKL